MTVTKFLVGLVAFSALALAQPTKLSGEIDTYLETWGETGRFMGAVLVARGDEIIFEAGYGLAEVESEEPNTPQTAFRLGSLSKPLTATAVLRLQDAGRLSVDDTLSEYLPDYPNGDALTLRHLLTHTSGVPDYARLPDYPGYMNTPMTLTELIGKFKNLPPLFPPGARYSYSNANYVLLGAVIEKVSGQSYGVHLQEHVFAPAGMGSSRYGDVPGGAHGYLFTDDGYAPASPIDLSVTAGAGGLVSTAGDLHAWVQALQRGLLDEETLSAMTAAAVPVGPSSSGSAAFYGLGWFVSDLFGRRVISHSGGVNGFSSTLLWLPDEDAVVIVLSNVDAAPVQEIGRGLAAILLGEPYDLPKVYREVDLGAERLARYAGRYALGPNVIVTVSLEGGDLYLESNSGQKARLYPFSDTDFFLKVADVTLQFVTNGDEVQGLVWRQGARELRGVRLE